MRARRLPVAPLIAALSLLGCAAGLPPSHGPSSAPAAASAPNAPPAIAAPSPLDAVTPSGASWYDPAPLLVSLRAPDRPALRQSVGVSDLSELPLYDLALRLDPSEGAFSLEEELWYTNREPADLAEIHLRLYGNPESGTGKPARMPIAMSTGQCDGQPCTITAPSPSSLVVKLARPLGPAGRIRIRLSLQGVLERRDPGDTNLLSQSVGSLGTLLGGKEQADYGLLSVCGDFASLANFYAVVARRRNGQWERPEVEAFGDVGPDDLSNVRARIVVPALVTVVTPGIAVSNALLPRTGSEPLQRRYDIGAAAVRNFAVFAAEGLRTTERRVGDVVLRSAYREGNDRPGARALDVAEKSLAIFEKRFGRYPWADLDVVEAPLVGGAGGVEFTGLVAIAGMLYRPFEDGDPLAKLLPALGIDLAGQVSSLMDATLEFTTAHEVAHQWWYGLVGTDSRAHPFVDESLAQYSTILYLEDRYGPARAQRDGDANVRMNYVAMRMFGQEDAPVDRPVSSFPTSMSYAGLVYGKGPYVYREIRKTVGDEPFFAGLRAYAEKYRFRIAPGRGPIDTFAAGAEGEKVRALARRWLDERHGDADLGPVDMSSLLSNVLGPDAAQLAPAMEELMKALGSDGAQ